MGWLWNTTSSEPDALSNLDSSTRQYLEKATPSQYKPSQPLAPVLKATEPTSPTPSPQNDAAAAVPPQSLFPDGRYAHLWKNYEPQSAIEARTMSDQEKLASIHREMQDRKYGLSEAAMENCVLEQLALKECYRRPSWSDTFTMCRGPNKKFIRCFEMQQKFLRALGYTAIQGGGEEHEARMERVQMHADELYQKMIRQEKERRRAEKEGREAPKYGPLFTKEVVASTLESASSNSKAELSKDLKTGLINWNLLKPETKKAYEARVEECKTEHEKELERYTIDQEIRQSNDIVRRVIPVLEEERRARLERKEKGKSSIGDRMVNAWRGE